MEGDGVGEATVDHRGEAGEARLVEVGGRDVPALEGATVLGAPCSPALAPPRAHAARRPGCDRRGRPARRCVARCRHRGRDDDEAPLGPSSSSRSMNSPLCLRARPRTSSGAAPGVETTRGELVAPCRGAGGRARPMRTTRRARPRRGTRSPCTARARTGAPDADLLPDGAPIAASSRGSTEQCSRRLMRSSCDGRALRIDRLVGRHRQPAPTRAGAPRRGGGRRRRPRRRPSIRQSSATSSSPSTGSMRVVAPAVLRRGP